MVSVVFIDTHQKLEKTVGKVPNILSKAVYFGYFEIVKQAMQKLNSFFSEFVGNHPGFGHLFGVELNGVQYFWKFDWIVQVWKYKNKLQNIRTTTFCLKSDIDQ